QPAAETAPGRPNPGRSSEVFRRPPHVGRVPRPGGDQHRLAQDRAGATGGSFAVLRGAGASDFGRRAAGREETLVSTKKLGGDASRFTPNFVRSGGPVVITEGEREVARAELPARSMVNSIQFL